MDANIPKIVLTLNVPSLEDTIAWYESVLGWTGHYDTYNENGEGIFGSVSCQQEPFVGFNLARMAECADQLDEDCPVLQIWVYVAEVDTVYARVFKHGYQSIKPPENKFWGERVFSLRDLNGFELVFSQSVETLDIEEIRRRHQSLQGFELGDTD